MRIPRIFTTLIVLVAGTCIQANAQNRVVREQLQTENLDLKRQVDSLNNLIHGYKTKIQEHEARFAEIEARQAEGYEVFNLGADAKDSISLWDAQERIGKIKEVSYNMDSVKLDSKVSDDIYLERLKNMNNIFTLPYNDIVRNYVVLYAEKRKSSNPTMLGLCSYYFPIFQETFNKYGIPEELACMAIIESAMNPRAVSKAGARGMWQFMYATGKSYGLRIDSYVDERLDVHKAADAAARYLLDAYKRFGDWSLAISSYNCGGGNITRAITRAGGKTEFWDIYPYLPKETRGYVPAFVGALYITKYYKEHGVNPKPCSLPEKVDTFLVHKKLHFTQIHDVIGVPMDELRNLNPQYVHDIVPGNEREYVLRIPAQFVKTFIENEDSIYRYKADSLFNPVVIKQIESSSAANSSQTRISYKIKSGDTLSKIATKYHVSVNDLKRWNNLKSTSISAGKTLYIYKPGAAKPETVSKPATTTTAKPAETKPAETKADETKEAEEQKLEGGKPVEPEAVEKPEEEKEEAVLTGGKPVEPEAVEKPAEDKEEAVLTGGKPVVPVAVEKTDDDDEEEEVIREISQHPGLRGMQAAADSAAKAAAALAAEQAKEATGIAVTETVDYIVKKGDTLYGISKKFSGVTADDIMKLNNVTTNLHPGDILRIPVKKQ